MKKTYDEFAHLDAMLSTPTSPFVRLPLPEKGRLPVIFPFIIVLPVDVLHALHMTDTHGCKLFARCSYFYSQQCESSFVDVGMLVVLMLLLILLSGLV